MGTCMCMCLPPSPPHPLSISLSPSFSRSLPQRFSSSLPHLVFISEICLESQFLKKFDVLASLQQLMGHQLNQLLVNRQQIFFAFTVCLEWLKLDGRASGPSLRSELQPPQAAGAGTWLLMEECQTILLCNAFQICTLAAAASQPPPKTRMATRQQIQRCKLID